MNNTRFPILVLACAIGLPGCSERSPSTPREEEAPASVRPAATAPPATPASPAEQPADGLATGLRNADYPIETTAARRALLREGVYEEAVAGSSGKNVVRLGPAPVFGDLDGDGAEDAAVTLLASPGGSGSFTYVAAVLNENGVARPTNSVLIGDRVSMRSMRIVDGQLQVTWLEREPGEPLSAAPGIETTRTFRVRDGTLEVVPRPRADAAQLRGHYTWGAEVETFKPCGSTQVFWVVGEKALLQQLRDKSGALARSRSKPYQPVYIEASGERQGDATDGFAMDYDGVYRLDAVRVANDVSPPDCAAT